MEDAKERSTKAMLLRAKLTRFAPGLLIIRWDESEDVRDMRRCCSGRCFLLPTLCLLLLLLSFQNSKVGTVASWMFSETGFR